MADEDNTNKKMTSEIMKLAWEIRKANLPGSNQEIVDAIKEQNKENALKKKEEKSEREMFFENFLNEFSDAFSNARSELAKPFKDASIIGLGKLLLGVIPVLAAGVIAGIYGSVTGLIGKIPAIKRIGQFFSFLTKGAIPNLVKSLVGKLPVLGKFFGFIGKIIGVVTKILKPVITLAKFGFQMMKPFFSSIGKFLKVFFKFGSVLGKLFLPVTIVRGIVEGLVASWSRFAEGDILGGIGAFFGGILDFFTFGIIDVEKFSAWWDSLFGNFIGFFKKLFSGDIMGALNDLGNFLLDWMVGLPEIIFDGILNAIGSIFEFFGMDDIGKWFKDFADVDILGTLKNFFAYMMSYVEPVIDVILLSFKAVFGSIKSVFADMMSYVEPVIDVILLSFKAVFGSIKSVFADMMSYVEPVIDVILLSFKAVFGSIKSVFDMMMDVIESTINYIADIPLVGRLIGDVSDLFGGGNDIVPSDLFGGGNDIVPRNRGVLPAASGTGVELQRQTFARANASATTPASGNAVQNNNVITHVQNNSYSQPPLNPRNSHNPHTSQQI